MARKSKTQQLIEKDLGEYLALSLHSKRGLARSGRPLISSGLLPSENLAPRLRSLDLNGFPQLSYGRPEPTLRFAVLRV
jgi:hypothetical protein